MSVALLLLDVGVAEMLDAQRTIEPALAGLAAIHGTAEHWDRLDRLIAESAAAVDEPDRFNELALATHDLIADAAGNRVLYATLISLRQVQSRHYRDLGSPETARAAVADHRELLAALRRGAPRTPPVRCSSISKPSDGISTPDGQAVCANGPEPAERPALPSTGSGHVPGALGQASVEWQSGDPSAP